MKIRIAYFERGIYELDATIGPVCYAKKKVKKWERIYLKWCLQRDAANKAFIKKFDEGSLP